MDWRFRFHPKTRSSVLSDNFLHHVKKFPHIAALLASLAVLLDCHGLALSCVASRVSKVRM
jgi:hypothetical protein